MKTTFAKNGAVFPITALVLVCVALCAGIVRSQSVKDTSAQLPAQVSIGTKPSLEPAFELPDYTKIPADSAERQTSQILEQRSSAISKLVLQVENPQTPNGPKAETIYLLGALRAPEATTALIENINFLDGRKFVADHINEREAFRHTARHSLIQIGQPASEWIMRIISDNHHLETVRFDKSQVEGFSEVLCGIETKKFALMKLQSEREKARDARIKGNFDLVIEGIEKMAK